MQKKKGELLTRLEGYRYCLLCNCCRIVLGIFIFCLCVLYERVRHGLCYAAVCFTWITDAESRIMCVSLFLHITINSLFCFYPFLITHSALNVQPPNRQNCVHNVAGYLRWGTQIFLLIKRTMVWRPDEWTALSGPSGKMTIISGLAKSLKSNVCHPHVLMDLLWNRPILSGSTGVVHFFFFLLHTPKYV